MPVEAKIRNLARMTSIGMFAEGSEEEQSKVRQSENMSIQAQGDLIPQRKPMKDEPQVKNYAGGYVFKIDDMGRLQRFLIMGCEGGTYYVREPELSRQNVRCLDRIIGSGRGVEAVHKIKEISVSRRNVKQNALLLAFAICARSNDKDTKKAAYALLSEICRIPTHLFMFIKYCEQESQTEVGGIKIGTGWGRAHKKAIGKWYNNFMENPEKLARLVTKFKNREGWSHKDVLRLAHPIPTDPCMGFILRYITKGLEKAKEMYIKKVAEIDETTLEHLLNLSKLMEKFDEAVHIRTEDEMCHVIHTYKLTWEQCNSEQLKKPSVWKSLLPHMPVEAMIRNLARMTSIGMFAEGSEEEQWVLDKISSMNSEVGLRESSEGPAETGVQPMETDGDDDDVEMTPETTRRRNILHPFKILLAICTYKSGQGEKGGLAWKPNGKILDALNSAFYKAFETVQSTGKKFYLAVDVSGSMSQPVFGSRNIHCSTAAAAMMMMTARTEQNCIIRGFSNDLVDIDVTPEDTLEKVQAKMDRIPMGGTDCSKPMFDAVGKKWKDIDVFVVYTDNETWYGNVHPVEALRQYRQYAANPNVKLIVCGMCSTQFSIADQDDPNMLDVVGFDSAAPRLMSEFVMGNL